MEVLKSRLGPAKVEFLIRNVAQLTKPTRVLEVFGGSSLSTAVLARYVRPDRIVSVDIAYGTTAWADDPRANYEALGPFSGPCPTFVRADATKLPFADGSFDYAFAPDSPRTRFESTGEEWGLGVGEQKALFLAAAQECLRVLTTGGLLAATAPRSWCDELGAREIPCNSRRLSFRACDDPVVYCRLRK
jgi:SAM-dependent methyltransferase